MTDKEAKKFYNSTMWKHKRMQILERDHYECQDCRKRLRDAVAAGDILRGEEKKIRRAEEVHHIVPIDLLKTYIRDEMQANNYALAQLIAEALSEMSLVIENQIQLGDKKLADVLVDAIIKKMSQNIKWKKGAAGV